jgi:hypothetical protein
MTDIESGEVYLSVPREEARRKLQYQVEDGELILRMYIANEQIFKHVRDRYYLWHDETRGILSRLFSSDRILEEFIVRIPPQSAYTALPERIQRLQRNVGSDLNLLRSLIQRLEQFEERLRTSSVTWLKK